MSVTELDGLSVTARARRAQIVEATIEVIASEGYAQASFARIAERAGLSSTRLISYHFAGKDDLVAAVVRTVVDGIGGRVSERVMAERTPRGMLRAYVEGVVGYAAQHRAHLAALLQVVVAGGPSPTDGGEASPESHVRRILVEGQRVGDFRDLDAGVVATAVQRAVEGVALSVAADPTLDADRCAAELATVFDLATRRTPG